MLSVLKGAPFAFGDEAWGGEASPPLLLRFCKSRPLETYVTFANHEAAAQVRLTRLLFRVPCRSGMCSTPMEVTSSQLISSEIFPLPLVKAMLYPGAVANGLITSRTVPSWDNLLNIYNLTNVKEASAVTDLQRLEVLAGSYFSVAGALIGILKPGRMSMFGTLLIVWGLIKEGILNKPTKVDAERAVYVYPTMLLALVCSFMSVKYDMKKVTRGAPARPVAKPLKSSSKAKLK